MKNMGYQVWSLCTSCGTIDVPMVQAGDHSMKNMGYQVWSLCTSLSLVRTAWARGGTGHVGEPVLSRAHATPPLPFVRRSRGIVGKDVGRRII